MATPYSAEIDDKEHYSYGSSYEEEGHGSKAEKLNKKSQDLQRKTDRLEKEINHLAQILEKEKQYNSASRDARKMFGDITPGDTTHKDVILMYQNHFKKAFRTMPRALNEQQPNKFKTWQMCADVVQKSFDANKKSIIETMMADLTDALDLEKDTVGILSEKKRDLHRAFKMMLSGNEHDEVCRELAGQIDDEVCHFVMSMIKKLDPADYKSFLMEGQLRNREKDMELPQEKN